jgi:hypothetical protein
MIGIRASTASKPNEQLRERARAASQTNSQWLAAALGAGDPRGAFLLVGGAGPIDFRLRVAQSHARSDLLPSFWSHAAIIRRAAGQRDWVLYEASLEPPRGFGRVAANNGIQAGRFAAYDDPLRYPNIACLQVRVSPQALGGLTLPAKLDQAVATFRNQRALLDLPSLLVQWLSFAWGAGDQGNPLLKGAGVPSAVLVEGLYAIAGVELTPGLASQSSCPEAIWQSAKWWHEFYESEASLTEAPISGSYFLGQPAAAVIEETPPAPAVGKKRRRTRR